MNKSDRETKVYDRDLSKYENFGIHSPIVGKYKLQMSSLEGPKYTISKSKKFLLPKHKVDLDKQLPHSYLKLNMEKNGESKNTSESNLPKQSRFRFRDIAAKEYANYPSPLNYNLSNMYSVSDKTTAGVLERLKQSRMKKHTSSLSRFEDKVFHPEYERLMQGN